MPTEAFKKTQKIQAALKDVLQGMSARQAADKHNICMATLQKNMQKQNIVPSKPPLEGLNAMEEQRLGNWLVYCYYMGYFQNSQSNLNKEAGNLAKRGVSKRRFDQEWCRKFPQRIPYVQKCLEAYEENKEVFAKCGNKWLGTVVTYCINENIYESFGDPQCLYYLLQLDMAENLKMIIAYSAEGITTPPLIINGDRKKAHDFEEMPMPHGWIKFNCDEPLSSRNHDITLIYYMEQVLKPYLAEENITKPILLFHKYLFQPLSLALFELCTDHRFYPINSHMQLSALKLHQSLQMEITFRMKSSANKNMSTYVDLMKEILEVKLTEERLCESFRESGLYPLNVGDFDVNELPRLQMKSINERDMESSGETSSFGERCNSPEAIQISTIAGKKRPYKEVNNKPKSGIFKIKKTHINELSPEKRPLPVSPDMMKPENFQHISLDDDDDDDDDNDLTSEGPLNEPEVEFVVLDNTEI